jgi:type VI secretion system secreted protein VgrG
MSDDHVEAHLESGDFSCAGVRIIKLSGREVISRLFSFEVIIALGDPDGAKVDEWLGGEAIVVFTRGGMEVRRVHGMITAVGDCPEDDGSGRLQRLRIEPVAARLALVEGADIYMDMTVPEIIRCKLALVGIGEKDVELRLTAPYAAREFVVQYGESDLAFVSRLAEHVGLAFFFEQRGDRAVMVFTDHEGGYLPIERPGAEGAVPFGHDPNRACVDTLSWNNLMMPKTYYVQDYDYRVPHLNLTGAHEADAGMAGGVIEFGTNHETADGGAALARIRAQERHARSRFYIGSSTVVELAAGGQAVIDRHPRFDRGKAFVIVEVAHQLTQPDIEVGEGEAARAYSNSFRAVDAGAPYRPPRVTPKPRISGVLAAHIEPMPDGTVGNVAPRDDLGRYIVKFSFDSTPLGERSRSSLRVRMIHQHGGPGYGIQMPLETGVEVLVAFVDGDPDRPVIVGAAHTPTSPPPVRANEHLYHRIRTKAGIEIEMKDH